MIHELLFYLWNCPGAIFKITTEEEWIISIDIEGFIHPSERKLLQKILAIGLQYHQVQEFIKLVEELPIVAYENTYVEHTAEVKPGLYLKAFCAGLDEVLQGYRNDIISTEEMFLKNPHLSLTYVLSVVENFRTLFEELKSMIHTIKRDHVHGCLLMGKLHSYIDCGVEPVVEAARRITFSINTIFYRQLCNWIIYGDLTDTCNEFFVIDDQCADENFLYAEQLKEPQQNVLGTFHEISQRSKLQKINIVRKFSLKKEMVPPNISIETAETILFLGRVVWIIRNDHNQPSEDKFHLRFTRDVWNGKAVEYYRKLQVLGKQIFNSSALDNAIEECRVKITQYLWEVMVHEAKLLEHLQLIRDYFALGRGELFQHFITGVQEHIQNPNEDHILNNLNFMFYETARKLYGENDRSYLRFQLALLPIKIVEDKDKTDESQNETPGSSVFGCKDIEGTKHVGFRQWDQLELTFNVGWPLHILFHPKAMTLYNKVFSFLLQIKKAQIDLNKLWKSHMEMKCQIPYAAWTLRNTLMFIINNLQYYIQVDVIEAQFSILKNSVQGANEFEDIIRLHSVFLKNLLTKTFIMITQDKSQEEAKHTLIQIPEVNHEGVSKVYTIIMDFTVLCEQFCKQVSRWDSQVSEYDLKDVLILQRQSDCLVENLLRCLEKLHKQASDHHLLQLVRHIDFNSWFTKTNKNLNLTVL